MGTKNYGSGLSGYLDPENRNWETVVYQASKAVLDKELNLNQDAIAQAQYGLRKRTTPSGWLSSDFLNLNAQGLWTSGVTTANLLVVPPLTAHVNGWLLDVANTGVVTNNNLDLGAGPSTAGSKRTDLVILEVWRRLITTGSSAGKSSSGRIWYQGNVKIPVGSDLTLNFADDILDTGIAVETTKRVQIQYRLRVINGVDLYTYPFGINDPTVVARSVPASAGVPDGTATVHTYANQSSNGDPGLWRAGDGDPANTLGTVDGYMYAIPLLAVFRRNTVAFARNTNHNGGASYPSASDRPDNLHSNLIAAEDIHDLRTGVSFSGWDLQEVVQKNVNFLLDNVNQTEIGATLLGGGVNGHTVLWADEIGVSNANGGDGTTTGDTPGAEFIGEFDAARRVFSDRPVYETVVLSFAPNSAGVSPGGSSWAPGTITINPTSLPIWPYTASNWSSRNSSGVTIVDVTSIVFSSATAGKISFEASDNFSVTGLGTVPQGNVVLYLTSLTDPMSAAVTNETLYVTLLIAYPPGLGLSKTPTQIFADNNTIPTKAGVFINNPAQLPTSAPILYSSLSSPSFVPANREVRLEYLTLSHTFTLRPNTDTTKNHILRLPERPVSGTVSITINGSPYGGSITLSGYTVTINTGVLVGNENVVVTYQSLRALPQNNEQLTVYYQARIPQTIRESLLSSTLQLTSRFLSQVMYVLTAGSGSEGQAYPFPYQYVQAGGVYPSSSGSFSGDHEMDGDLRVSTVSVYADTGFMQVPTHVPLAPTPNAIELGRSPGDADIEGRTFYKTSTGYGFLAIGTALSDPKKHKNIVPILCELPADTSFGKKGQLVLVLLTRWATFDASNMVGFDSTLSQNFTSASVYRIKGNLLSFRRS